MFNATNGQINAAGETTDYISFGRGTKNLIMIPGVGDGLKTVKGMAIPFAFLYRALAKDFKVYVFSRPVNLKPGATTEDMAESLFEAMKKLNISSASIVGVSQGGMIAQYLTLNHSEVVERLVLVVTLARPNPTVISVINRWTEMARKGDYKGIMLSTAELSYSPKKTKQSKLAYGLLGSISEPKSFDRFLIQADSCITHDAYERLEEINCPTLVIGGTEDKIVSGESSKELAERIPGSELFMYEGLGHGLYEEAKDFIPRVAEFCKR
ncbi:MAG: alpha/beta hydrolase [Firmicutes bacterium]|nr:alpha/beta hydrolase [Bacillota bacterium]